MIPLTALKGRLSRFLRSWRVRLRQSFHTHDCPDCHTVWTCELAGCRGPRCMACWAIEDQKRDEWNRSYPRRVS